MAEYIDITIVEAMDEPVDIYIYDDEGNDIRSHLLCIRSDFDGDVEETTYRIQHNDIERL